MLPHIPHMASDILRHTRKRKWRELLNNFQTTDILKFHNEFL